METQTARRRKTRRGKKKVSKLTFENMENFNWVCGCGSADENNSPDLIMPASVDFTVLRGHDHDKGDRCFNSSSLTSRKRKQIRPDNSPRAPPNSNQFLIEDRLATMEPSDIDFNPYGKVHIAHTPTLLKAGYDKCADNYFSNVLVEDLATNVGLQEAEASVVPGEVELESRPPVSPVYSDWRLSPAYSDVDYAYKPFPDVHMLTYQEQEFERDFQKAREDKLAELSEADLILGITKLEETVSILKQSISHTSMKMSEKSNTNQFHRTLEDELLQLQNKNEELIRENNKQRSSSDQC